MKWKPVVYLADAQDAEAANVIGWKGPGWYFCDPANRYADFFGPWAVEGPYVTEELAKQEFQAYCEAMTV